MLLQTAEFLALGPYDELALTRAYLRYHVSSCEPPHHSQETKPRVGGRITCNIPLACQIQLCEKQLKAHGNGQAEEKNGNITLRTSWS